MASGVRPEISRHRNCTHSSTGQGDLPAGGIHYAPKPLSDFFFGAFRLVFLEEDGAAWKAAVSKSVPEAPPDACRCSRDGPYPAFFLSSSSCRWSRNDAILKYATPNVTTERATTARVNMTPITGSSGAGTEATTSAAVSAADAAAAEPEEAVEAVDAATSSATAEMLVVRACSGVRRGAKRSGSRAVPLVCAGLLPVSLVPLVHSCPSARQTPRVAARAII